MSSSAAPKKIWTILDLLNWGTEYLKEKKIEDARLTIELLLSHVLSYQRIQLYTSFDKPLSDEELARFKELLKRRLANEPLQYITGSTQFMGLPFAVDRRVLIPRPETEILVDQCVKTVKQSFANEGTISILDLGTGSGCIAVALAKLLPASTVTAVDVSVEALAVAQQNAVTNNLQDRVRFEQNDILQMSGGILSEKFHCIISNPPYISEKEFAEVSKDVKDFEPNSALTDHGDGLKFYPPIASFAMDHLTGNGFVCVEHAYDQSELVQKIFAEYGFIEPVVIKDYQGINRHLLFVKKS
ncbi:MAG: peptide chain release factor N(5)-glutamine methyltransferase [Bacteroidota bacterium]